jgi:hypothetical protein
MHILFVNHLFGPNISSSNTQPDNNIAPSNKQNLTLEDDTMNISNIEQENDNLFFAPRFATHTNHPISDKLQTKISPAHTPTQHPTTIIDRTQVDSNLKPNESNNNDGFTIVQNYQKTNQKSSLEQLKKAHNIQKQGLPTPQESFCNLHIAYYDLRVPLVPSKGDESPWDKVMRSFKALMTEIWAADPATKAFIYSSKMGSRDTSFLDSPRSLK